jgi:hypothetical protein
MVFNLHILGTAYTGIIASTVCNPDIPNTGIPDIFINPEIPGLGSPNPRISGLKIYRISMQIFNVSSCHS